MTIHNPDEADLTTIRAQIHAGQLGVLLAELEGLPPKELADAVKPWRGVAGRLYREAKDLDAFIDLSDALIHRLDWGLSTANEEDRLLLVPPLCGTCYNLASFALAEWDEPWIHVGPYALDAGGRAARRCLDLRKDPDNTAAKFGVTLEMAFWVVGAQALAVGDFMPARAAFEAAIQAARAAGESDRLERGYLALTYHVEAPFNTDAATHFEEILAEYDPKPGVKRGEHDAFFQGQLRTARRVILGWEPADGV